MENLSDVEHAYLRALDLLVEREVPVINAQVSVGAPGAVVWLDVDLEVDVLEAALRVIDTCAVRFVAASAAVDGDEEERSLVFVGDVLIGLRFGVEVDDDDDFEQVSGFDAATVEDEVLKLSASVIERVSSFPGVEPSNFARIQQLVDEAFAEFAAGDERMDRVARSRASALVYEIAEEIRRRHRRGFADRAEEIADSILASRPNVLSMNLTALRPLVHDYLRTLDHECATQRAGEPVVQALRAKAKAPAAGAPLF
ncbi:hypothetical protein ACFRJ9_17105 [Paenarthrobacter sp. NPDC056912]|uniref:hypothetical protein n=1 Tax=Paenarthrobacter sp. NPDC056912 TaxID=3345965 RepID=UPI00367295AD